MQKGGHVLLALSAEVAAGGTCGEVAVAAARAAAAAAAARAAPLAAAAAAAAAAAFASACWTIQTIMDGGRTVTDTALMDKPSLTPFCVCVYVCVRVCV